MYFTPIFFCHYIYTYVLLEKIVPNLPPFLMMALVIPLM